MVYDDSRISTMRSASKIAASVGAVFGIIGILLLYYYVYTAFEDAPTRIGWWATISIVLAVLFCLAYFMVSDTVRSMERAQRLDQESRLEREERVRKSVRP